MAPKLSREEASLRGRIGAYTLHSKHDPKQTTEKARSTFLASFEKQVDPDGMLPEPERLRRAEMAKKAHYARLALLSARKRRGKAEEATDQAGA